MTGPRRWTAADRDRIYWRFRRGRLGRLAAVQLLISDGSLTAWAANELLSRDRAPSAPVTAE